MTVNHIFGPVAQRLEQGTHNPLVPGSNPGGPSCLREASRAACVTTASAAVFRRFNAKFGFCISPNEIAILLIRHAEPNGNSG